MITSIEATANHAGKETLCALCGTQATHIIDSSDTPLCESHKDAFEWGIANAEAAAMKGSEKNSVSLEWSIEDVLEHAPHLTMAETMAFIDENKGGIRTAARTAGDEYIEYVLPDDSETIECEYTSEWDCGTVITTKGEYQPNTKEAEALEQVEVEGLNSCVREYITLPNGITLGIEFGEVVEGSRKEATNA